MTATTTGHGLRRAAVAIVLALGGVAVAAATWIAGDHGWAIGAIVAYAVLAAGTYLWAGRSGDVAALLRADGDERQRGLDRAATAVTGLVLVAAALLGALVSLGRTGNPGVYGEFCALAGVTYAVTLFVLHRRR